VQRYLHEYAERHQLAPQLRLRERVRQVRFIGSAGGSGPEWEVETGLSRLRSRYLAIATAVNRSPWLPEIPGREIYTGVCLHSAAYRNATPFRGQRVLVVGSGNSAAEICLDLVEGGAAAVAMWVRGPRHFLPQRSVTRVFRVLRWLGALTEAKGDALHRLTYGTPEFARAIAGPDRIFGRLSRDLRRFGIRRPDGGPFAEISQRGRIPVFDVGAIREIERRRIRVIDGNLRPLEAFTEQGVRFGDGAEPFDAVILATGFHPELDAFLAEPDMLGPVRWLERGPLTDLRSRSVVHPTAFFPGFDPSPIGGRSLGRWGWEAGGTIARELRGG
jgi:indole-3-pyruvate monooxygenase